MSRFNDILPLNFVDHYSNLTLKTMAGVRWAIEHCPGVDLFVHSDDDMYVDLPRVQHYVRDNRLGAGGEPFLLCRYKYYFDKP